MLDYTATGQGSLASSLTITFENPTGDDVVVSGQPMDGQALWPGIVVDGDGTVVDWPGWRLEDGVWAEGDEFDWALGNLTVDFDAGPTASEIVSDPAATDTCIPTPEGAVEAGGATPDPSPSDGNGAPEASAAPSTLAPPQTDTAGPIDTPAGSPVAILLLVFAGALVAAVALGPVRRRGAR